jgi:hypothetical protein
MYLYFYREYLLFIQGRVTSKLENEATRRRVVGQKFQAPDQQLSVNSDK